MAVDLEDMRAAEELLWGARCVRAGPVLRLVGVMGVLRW